MTIWVVLRNGGVDEVFDTRAAAEHHAKMLNKTWSITCILEREVKSL
jgi:dsDNA-binding SOS-regulon protein